MKTRDFIINMLFACCAMGTVACSDEAGETPVPDREATIYLNFKTAATEPHSGIRALQQAGTPATELWMDAGTADSAPTEGKMTAGTTRAPMTRAVNEDGIQTVDLLAFKTGSNPNDIKQGAFFYRVRGEYDPANRSVKVRLISDPHAQTLVLVANARDKVDRLAAALGEAKEDVMKRLLVSATADGQPDLSSGYMPMWGELPNQTIDANYGNGTSATAPKTTVTMIRPVAKVTLKCSDAPGKSFFGKFEELRLYNYRSKGRISPDNCTAPNAPGMTVNTPTVPDNATVAQGTYKELHSFGDPAILAGQEKSFYLFEADNRAKAGESGMKATCLIVHVKFNSATPEGQALEASISPHFGYYRIDFRDYDTDQFFDLLRNHHYVIETQSVDSPPAATPEDALKGQHTLKCRIVPWNEVQEEVKVPGNKRLSVDTRSIRMSGASAISTGKTLTVTTENTQGWTITDVPSWLTVSPTSSTTDNTSSVTVKSNGTDIINSGSFKLKAGNAEMAIHVKLGKALLEYVAEYNLAGGSQYGSKPNNPSLVTDAQTDGPLRWATSHNNDQSGYYNWYVLKGVAEDTFNPAGKNLFDDAFFTTGEGKGYHLPSRQELTGVFSYSYNAQYGGSIDQSVNEACEYGGIKKTFAADYYSTGNGVCYALRFKQATGDPNDDSPLSEFPKAADNSMCYAYRYTRIGSFAYDNNLTSQLKIECIYVGDDVSIDINTIKNDAWWISHSSETVTRIFPAAGYIYPAPVSGLGTFDSRGYNGYYWSGTEDYSSFAWDAHFHSNYAHAYHSYFKDSGFAVRLFSSE